MEENLPQVCLLDYMLSYQKGENILIESVVYRIRYYEAYLKAMKELKAKQNGLHNN